MYKVSKKALKSSANRIMSVMELVDSSGDLSDFPYIQEHVNDIVQYLYSQKLVSEPKYD